MAKCVVCSKPAIGGSNCCSRCRRLIRSHRHERSFPGRLGAVMIPRRP